MKKLAFILSILCMSQGAMATNNENEIDSITLKRNVILQNLKDTKEKFSTDFKNWQNSLTKKDLIKVNGAFVLKPAKIKQVCRILQTAVDDLTHNLDATRDLATENQQEIEIPTHDEIVAKCKRSHKTSISLVVGVYSNKFHFLY